MMDTQMPRYESRAACRRGQEFVAVGLRLLRRPGLRHGADGPPLAQAGGGEVGRGGSVQEHAAGDGMVEVRAQLVW